MALPYSPRTSFDLTVDLNVNDVRTYNSNTYNGKHIRIIPKRAIDTARGLAFYDCASVTIIGGHFKPPPKGWGQSATGSKAPGTLTFTTCGEVYLEGVVTDNANLIVDLTVPGENGGDALYVAGKTANTLVTVQNCAFLNVRGTQLPKEAHGDIFQTGSTTMGRAGAVRFYNVTGTCDYQGFFMDPQRRPDGETRYPDGTMASLRMERVNVRRTRIQGTQKFRLIFLWDSELKYIERGYPVTFENVWLNGTGDHTLEDTVWPSNFTASNGSFDEAKYRAQFGTDSIGRYAHYPLMTDPGKTVTGRIYQGDPPGGDFCPASRIGVGYIQGTDLVTGETPEPQPEFRSLEEPRFTAVGTTTWLDFRRTLAGSATLTGIALAPIAHGQWTGEGSGTIVADGETGVQITASGGLASARRSFETVPGRDYALTFEQIVQTGTVSIGSVPTATNILAGTPSEIGQNTVTFTAATTISHAKWTTGAAGIMSVSNIQLAPTTWVVSGPGTVSNLTDTTVTLTGVGGTPTIARRSYATVPGQRYAVSWTSDSATGTWAIGTTPGGGDIATAGPSFLVGANTAIFTATTATTYFQFQRTSVGTVNLTGIGFALNTSSAWTSGGPGTVSIVSDSQISLAGTGGAATYARRSFNTVPGRKYRFAASFSGNTGSVKIGTTPGDGELVPLAASVSGANNYDFVADTSPTYVEIERIPTGTATVTGLTMTETSVHAWTTSGTVEVLDNESVIITGGVGTAYAQRPFATVQNREYVWSYDQSTDIASRTVGSAAGSSDIVSLSGSTVGTNSVRFAAKTHQSWIRLERAGVSDPILFSGIFFNLLDFDNSSLWTTGGNGTVAIAADETISITGTGVAATYGQRSYNTVPGQAYSLTFNVTGVPCAYMIGTTEGGTDIKPQTTGNPGTVVVKFVAATDLTHLQVQRTGTGTTVITKPVMDLTTIDSVGIVEPIIQSFNDATLGGIGQPYLFVDRLSDSATDGSGNSGSLRWCLAQGSNRLILSTVQGVITRQADLNITAGQHHVTIAGFTGPGPLVLQGSWNFGVRGNDNVIEHLAFEREYNSRGASNGDGIQLVTDAGRDVNHILVRNCYAAHSQDELFQIFQSRNPADNQIMRDVSLHWNVFTNPLDRPSRFNSTFTDNSGTDHGFGTIIGGFIPRVDYQKNVSANCRQRNPRISAPGLDHLIANSAVVNWDYGGIGFQSETDDTQVNNPAGSLRYRLSVIGCVGVPGPNTSHPNFISQWGSGRLGGNSLICLLGNSVKPGLNAAVTASPELGWQSAATIPYPEFPGVLATRQDPLTLVQAIAQATLLNELTLNAGPFPKLRATNPNLLKGVTQAIGQMNGTVAGRIIDDVSQGPGLSAPPTVIRPLTGNLAPPADHTNVDQVKAWLQARRLEVSYA